MSQSSAAAGSISNIIAGLDSEKALQTGLINTACKAYHFPPLFRLEKLWL